MLSLFSAVWSVFTCSAYKTIWKDYSETLKIHWNISAVIMLPLFWEIGSETILFLKVTPWTPSSMWAVPAFVTRCQLSHSSQSSHFLLSPVTCLVHYSSPLLLVAFFWTHVLNLNFVIFLSLISTALSHFTFFTLYSRVSISFFLLFILTYSLLRPCFNLSALPRSSFHIYCISLSSFGSSTFFHRRFGCSLSSWSRCDVLSLVRALEALWWFVFSLNGDIRSITSSHAQHDNTSPRPRGSRRGCQCTNFYSDSSLRVIESPSWPPLSGPLP